MARQIAEFRKLVGRFRYQTLIWSFVVLVLFIAVVVRSLYLSGLFSTVRQGTVETVNSNAYISASNGELYASDRIPAVKIEAENEVGTLSASSGVSVVCSSDAGDSAKMLVQAYREFVAEAVGGLSGLNTSCRSRLIQDYEIYCKGRIIAELVELNSTFMGLRQECAEFRLRNKRGGRYDWLELNGASPVDVGRLPEIGLTCRQGTIGYVRWRHCLPGTAARLFSMCDEFTGLVIDLRGNPGGHLIEAIVLTGHWVPRKKVIELYHNMLELDKSKPFATLTTKDGSIVTMPIVFVTDAQTGSTAEVVVAIMKAWGCGKSVGQKTMGDGIAYISLEADVPGPETSRTIQALIRVPGLGESGLYHNRGVPVDLTVPLDFISQDEVTGKVSTSFDDRCREAAFRLLGDEFHIQSRQGQ